MKDEKVRRTSRVRNLVIALALTAIILSVSTYAWFIGLRTVSVTDFDVEIAVTDDLMLSLDGKNWDYSVSINQDNHKSVSYEGNTNWWSGNGLIPMSSVGDIDPESSRMILYEKASLTPTAGGYRLIASRVGNDAEGIAEIQGYVAFDLFIKNSTGTQYIKKYDQLDEEAIYLDVTSSVGVASSGVENTGIENSVRVAFAQIGRVAGNTTTQATITGIKCNENEGDDYVDGDVTSICSRTAQIWEPNDTNHVAGAISMYETACKVRTDATTYTGEYGGCKTVEDGTAYNTYAVNRVIKASDGVDVYDGDDYNTYGGSLAPVEEVAAALKAFPYFTDTHKMLSGTARPEFMTLAPNSITKVRVYIFLEGQDIDNYDFASVGKAISVKFGFTKQRFVQDNLDYQSDGPDITSITPSISVAPTTEEQGG